VQRTQNAGFYVGMNHVTADPPIKEGFRFGRFALDVRARELRKDGGRIRLQDQPFEVLIMLLRQPGEVIARDDLRLRLWPNGTFVDFEHGLNAAVKRLRAAIGDNAERPRFIETLHRRGYRFIADVERIDLADPGPARHSLSAPRLVVLPFSDLGEKNGPGYFSEGLTEEMITQLGRRFAGRLGVLARHSSMLVQRNARTARDIGQTLSADYLLEGTVRREADRVRITARLIETRSEMQLWADSYERDFCDCFLVQSEVAMEIAHSLALELIPESAAPPKIGTPDVEAHQAYLKGRYHWNKAGGDGLPEAIRHYEAALTLAPGFASAHSALARAHVAAADYYVREPRAALEAGRVSALRALQLEPTDADAHLVLAEVARSVDWDWGRAEEGYRRALACNPSSEAAHRLYGLFLALRGRHREATGAAGRACELDPLCLVVNTSAAWVRYLGGAFQAAIDLCTHTLGMDAAFAPAHRVRAAALLQLDRAEEAVAVLEGVPGRRDPIAVAWLAHALGTQGHQKRAQTELEHLGPVAADQYVSPYHVALGWVAIGDIDQAFQLLNRACEDRDPSVVNLAAEPRWAPVRSDGRYRQLVGRLGLS
jgi:TolB-like protein/Tfp pilus assembly protein PilF